MQNKLRRNGYEEEEEVGPDRFIAERDDVNGRLLLGNGNAETRKRRAKSET